MGYTARHAASKVARKPARVTVAVAAAAAVGAVVAASVAGTSASGHTAAQSAADARAELTSKSMFVPISNAFAANPAAAPGKAKDADITTHKPAAAGGSGKQAASAAKPAAAKPAPATPAHGKPAHGKSAPAKPAAAKHAPAKPAPAKQAPAKPAPPWTGPSTFYDSVLPGAIPAGQWAAVYSDGRYQASYGSLAGRKTLMWIDAHGTNPTSNALDIEPGDATPAGAAAWVYAKLTMNPHSTAILYTFKGDWGEVQADVNALPSWMHSHVRYWIADPTGYPHIVPGSDATQWYWGPNYDISQANQSLYT